PRGLHAVAGRATGLDPRDRDAGRRHPDGIRGPLPAPARGPTTVGDRPRQHPRPLRPALLREKLRRHAGQHPRRATLTATRIRSEPRGAARRGLLLLTQALPMGARAILGLDPSLLPPMLVRRRRINHLPFADLPRPPRAVHQLIIAT